MRNLDDELGNALRREEPPAGFAERVVARAGEARRRPGQTSSRPGPFGPGQTSSRPGPFGPGFFGGSKGPALLVARWAAAAAIVAAVGGTGIHYRTAQLERARAERAAGEAAGQRVMLALQIAGSKLQLVRTRINRLHEQTDRNTTH